jgi:hypothetical protein
MARFSLSSIKGRLGEGSEKDPSKIYLDPARDWLILLALFFVGIGGVSVYSYDVFLTAQNPEVIGAQDTVDMQQIKYKRYQKELASTIEYYREKDIAFNLLVEEGVTVFEDPSGVYVNDEAEVEEDEGERLPELTG